MSLTLADLPGAGAPAALNSAVVEGGITHFRHTLALTLPTGGMAQGLVVDDTCQFDVTFAPREFNALAAGAAEPASLAGGGPGLMLRLPVARPITRILLTNTQAGDGVSVFRFDGNNVTEDPVATAPHIAGQGAAIGITDRQLVLRRSRGGNQVSLSPDDIAAVYVQAVPAAPRLAFRLLPDDAEGKQALPPAVDAQGAPTLPLTDHAGPRLAAALTTQVARFQAARLAAGQPALPASLGIELIFTADSPCLVTVSALSIGAVLERRGFGNGEAKQVLRFAGGSRDTQQVQLAMPPGITALAASLHLSHSAAGAPATLRLAPAPEATMPALGNQGLRVGAGRLAAGALSIAEARVATGVEVALGGLSDTGQAIIGLWQEASGWPATLLAETAPLAIAPGRPAPRRLAFAVPLALPAGRCWLSLRAVAGDLIMALSPDPNGSLAESDGQGWAGVKGGQGFGPTARLLAPMPATAPSATVPDTLLGLRLGNAVLLAKNAGQEQVVDLTAALNQAGASPVLEISSAIAGMITLQPLLLRYRLHTPA